MASFRASLLSNQRRTISLFQSLSQKYYLTNPVSNSPRPNCSLIFSRYKSTLTKKHTKFSSFSPSMSSFLFSERILLNSSSFSGFSILPCRCAHIYRSNSRPKPERPKAQTTIDEEELSKFSALANLWWDETGEFEALHSMNALRVPLVRDALKDKNSSSKDYNPLTPLQGLKIIDIGSGGGILTEPLARLGATLIGIDASEENIRTAQAHLRQDPSIVCKVKYINSTVEDLVATEEKKFDALVASEVVEHVADVGMFVDSCCRLVKPGGSLFFTTINKTPSSYLLGVFVAERVLRLVAPGTHDWKKFIPPSDLLFMIESNGFTTRLVHGMKYSPFSKKWSWTPDTSINYAIHAIKNED